MKELMFTVIYSGYYTHYAVIAPDAIVAREIVTKAVGSTAKKIRFEGSLLEFLAKVKPKETIVHFLYHEGF